MRSPFHRPIWVGLNPNTPDDLAQAIVWVESKDDNGKVSAKTIPAIIRPQGVVKNGMCFYVHRSVVGEIKKMGIDPTSIEVRGQNYIYVYDVETYSLLYKEPIFENKQPLCSDEV